MTAFGLHACAPRHGAQDLSDAVASDPGLRRLAPLLGGGRVKSVMVHPIVSRPPPAAAAPSGLQATPSAALRSWQPGAAPPSSPAAASASASSAGERLLAVVVAVNKREAEGTADIFFDPFFNDADWCGRQRRPLWPPPALPAGDFQSVHAGLLPLSNGAGAAASHTRLRRCRARATCHWLRVTLLLSSGPALAWCVPAVTPWPSLRTRCAEKAAA
jgi:hypothetical protein